MDEMFFDFLQDIPAEHQPFVLELDEYLILTFSLPPAKIRDFCHLSRQREAGGKPSPGGEGAQCEHWADEVESCLSACSINASVGGDAHIAPPTSSVGYAASFPSRGSL